MLTIIEVYRGIQLLQAKM